MANDDTGNTDSKPKLPAPSSKDAENLWFERFQELLMKAKQAPSERKDIPAAKNLTSALKEEVLALSLADIEGLWQQAVKRDLDREYQNFDWAAEVQSWTTEQLESVWKNAWRRVYSDRPKKNGFDIVQKLLAVPDIAKKLDVNKEFIIECETRLYGWSKITVRPLVSAAAMNKSIVVAMLLGVGASLDVHDPSGMTPLMAAAEYGFIGPIKLLLDGGADPALSYRQDKTCTARFLAEQRHQDAAVALLEKAEAKKGPEQAEAVRKDRQRRMAQQHLGALERV